ncbi:MAG: phenylalanine--tRNA ligase subunit alpha [Candidatus Amoebophilus sp.]
MLQQLDLIQHEIQQYHPTTLQELEEFRIKFLSKKGTINQLFTEFGQLSPADKQALGSKLNALKQIAQEKYKIYASQLQSTPKQTTAVNEDYTLPPPADKLGSRHPISILKDRILEIFEKIGFSVVEGPEIEDDWHNFGALNFSPNHPARDMLDTFFISQSPDILLRTHTSSVQIRVAESQTPPIRAISIGRVYRNETISARSHCMFHQVDAFYVNKNVSFVELKQVLLYFLRSLFGEDIKMRIRPSYFPFTEPSVEIDINCRICNGNGCNICKHSGWLEIMGAGMIDPNVLKNCHIDPTTYTGYAFGMGLERVAMLMYQINDLRLFTENDVRFLKQFKAYA